MSADSLRRAAQAKHERALQRDRQFEPFLRENALRGCGWLGEQLDWPPWKVQKTMRRLGILLRHKTGPATPERNPSWKGGRIVDKGGYILIRKPDHPQANSGGYVREHRLVMERTLGRYLLPEEVVHHKNGRRDDNRPENLGLYPNNGLHMVLEWTGRKHSLETRRKMSASALAQHRRASPETRQKMREAAQQRRHRLRKDFAPASNPSK